MSIKDSFEVVGFPATCGSPRLSGYVPEHDAVAIARLREAGVVILGKSNVPALSGDWQTDNSLFGRTSNPWDRSRTPGGSSGGAVTAVSTGMSSLELGSDVGGSIRWPCHAVGVFGHKPTWGLVDTHGHIPPAPWFAGEPDILVAGPISRSTFDLSLAMSVLSRRSLPAFSKPRRRWRIGVLTELPDVKTSGTVIAAVRLAASILRDAGAVVDEVPVPFAFGEIWSCYRLQLARMHHAGHQGHERRAWARRVGEFDADDPSAAAWLARAAAQSDNELMATLAPRQQWLQQLASFFDTYDVLLMPPAPIEAPPHDPGSYVDRALLVDGTPRSILEMTAWISPASVLQLPATTAPVQRASGQLPCGVQIVGPIDGDSITLAVAAALEKAQGGYVPPPLAMTTA